MSRTRKDSKKGGQRQRDLAVRSVRRTPPDLRKMSRAVVRIAMEEAAAEKAAQEEAERNRRERPDA